MNKNLDKFKDVGDENILEGSHVLEKLAEMGKVDDFYEAIDSDDEKKIFRILKQAQIHPDTIKRIWEQIRAERD